MRIGIVCPYSWDVPGGVQFHVRDLAEVWKPDVPVDRNPEYIARARQLNRDLEVALMARFAGMPDEDAPDRPLGD